MWNAALVFFYGSPVAGREAQALGNFTDAITFFGKLAADGRCAEPEMFHYGFGDGMMIVRAESVDAIQKILDTDEGMRLVATASLTTMEFRYEFMFTGERLMANIANWSTVGSGLGYL